MQFSIFLCLSQARINLEGCGRKGIRCKNGGIDGDGFPISPHGVAPSRIVDYHALHHIFQKKLSSGTGSPGWSRKMGRKMVMALAVVFSLCATIFLLHLDSSFRAVSVFHIFSVLSLLMTVNRF